MEKEIIVASNNQGKIREIEDSLKEYKVVSMKELGIDIEIEEDGKTLAEIGTEVKDKISHRYKALVQLRE